MGHPDRHVPLNTSALPDGASINDFWRRRQWLRDQAKDEALARMQNACSVNCAPTNLPGTCAGA